jgi:osmotically-inducible protein OsmY
MSFVSKVKGLGLLLVGAAGGAAASYYLDPDRGRSRRAETGAQIGATLRDSADEVRRQASYQAGQVKGVAAETAGLGTGGELDDRTLKHKVETEVFGRPGFPKGKIVVTAHDGIVGLRGEVPTLEVREEILRETQKIPQVRGIEDLMHLPGDPAPNREPSASTP